MILVQKSYDNREEAVDALPYDLYMSGIKTGGPVMKWKPGGWWKQDTQGFTEDIFAGLFVL